MKILGVDKSKREEKILGRTYWQMRSSQYLYFYNLMQSNDLQIVQSAIAVK